MNSLLHNLTTDQVIVEPFPHLVVANALDAEFCDQLQREFPPMEAFTQGKAYRDCFKIQYPSAKSLSEPYLTERWREFTLAHLAPDVFQDLVRIFRPHLFHEYPDFEQRFGDVDHLRVGTRGMTGGCDVLMDSQAIIHMPIHCAPAAERGPHLKTLNKPFAAFLFLRSKEDTSVGGELEMFSLKPGVEPVYGKHQVIDHSYLRLEKSVPFTNNTLVVFLNTPRSIQGFGLRSKSELPTTYFNFVATLNGPLFSVDSKQQPRPASNAKSLPGSWWSNWRQRFRAA
jgi:hypothetical protein